MEMWRGSDRESETTVMYPELSFPVGFVGLFVCLFTHHALPICVSHGSDLAPSPSLPSTEMIDKAIDMGTHKPAHRIIFQRDAGRAVLDPARGDLDWHSEMQRIHH